MSLPTDSAAAALFNAGMSHERPRVPSKEAPPQQQQQPRAGRSGEGARSVLPHLKADLRARAVARVAKRSDRDF